MRKALADKARPKAGFRHVKILERYWRSAKTFVKDPEPQSIARAVEALAVTWAVRGDPESSESMLTRVSNAFSTFNSNVQRALAPLSDAQTSELAKMVHMQAMAPVIVAQFIHLAGEVELSFVDDDVQVSQAEDAASPALISPPTQTSNGTPASDTMAALKTLAGANKLNIVRAGQNMSDEEDSQAEEASTDEDYLDEDFDPNRAASSKQRRAKAGKGYGGTSAKKALLNPTKTYI